MKKKRGKPKPSYGPLVCGGCARRNRVRDGKPLPCVCGAAIWKVGE